MKKFHRSLLGCILLCGLMASVIGCKSSLEPGGAYSPGVSQVTTNAAGVITTNFVESASPDIAFYFADATYDAAYSTIDAAFKWERDNRAELWKLSPKIKQTLDEMRPTAWDIQQRWAVARAAYLANPLPANLTTMQQIVVQIQNIVPAITAAESLAVTNTPTH